MLGIGGNPGSLNVNVNVSWLDKYEIASLPGTPMLDYSETIGNDALGGLSHPTWKGIGTLTYVRDGCQIGSRARYIGKMGNSQNGNAPLSLEWSTEERSIGEEWFRQSRNRGAQYS